MDELVAHHQSIALGPVTVLSPGLPVVAFLSLGLLGTLSRLLYEFTYEQCSE